MSQTYTPQQLVGKVFVANKNVSLLRHPKDKKPFMIVKAKNNIGTLYSWVTDKKTNDIYWMFYDSKNQPFYFKHVPNGGLVNISALTSQGAKTEEDLRKEEKESQYGKVELFFRKYGIWIAGTALGIAYLSHLKNSN